jgi:hypothetical protein
MNRFFHETWQFFKVLKSLELAVLLFGSGLKKNRAVVENQILAQY